MIFLTFYCIGNLRHFHRFIHFNVGAFGSESDGSVWAEDRLGHALMTGQLENWIPEPDYLPGDENTSLRVTRILCAVSLYQITRKRH